MMFDNAGEQITPAKPENEEDDDNADADDENAVDCLDWSNAPNDFKKTTTEFPDYNDKVEKYKLTKNFCRSPTYPDVFPNLNSSDGD